MAELQQHVGSLNQFANLVEVTKAIPKEAAETFVTNPIIEIQKLSSKVLIANNIMTYDRAQEEEKIVKLFQLTTKMQTETLRLRDSFALKTMLHQTTDDIKATIGATISEETSSVLNTLNANFLEIDVNFTKLKERIDELENNVIGTLSTKILEGKD